jgi:hypothetical protein
MRACCGLAVAHTVGGVVELFARASSSGAGVGRWKRHAPAARLEDHLHRPQCFWTARYDRWRSCPRPRLGDCSSRTGFCTPQTPNALVSVPLPEVRGSSLHPGTAQRGALVLVNPPVATADSARRAPAPRFAATAQTSTPPLAPLGAGASPPQVGATLLRHDHRSGSGLGRRGPTHRLLALLVT